MVIDELTKQIMRYKERIGAFSMDLYFDDIASENECYVAKLTFPLDMETKHFRAKLFLDALVDVLHYVVTKDVQ